MKLIFLWYDWYADLDIKNTLQLVLEPVIPDIWVDEWFEVGVVCGLAQEATFQVVEETLW